ncbi:MAG: alpha/beta hydrolase fold domain-containing protein [Polyangiaceae bacterium]|nr:alpha/beta hydrolase fold domain-containing protein [Polyangiaceae bacterium]
MTWSLRRHRSKWLRRALLLAVATVCLGSCTLVARHLWSTRGLSKRTLIAQGRKRVVYVHVPPGHSKSKAVPLVIALHGNGGSAALLNRGTRYGLTREADARGWVLLLPQGIDEAWNDHRPFKQEALAGVDDVAFLTQLIDVAQRDYGIDPEQVFVVGASNGGAMAMTLAIEQSERFRGIAAVVMSLPGIHEAATPQRPISVLMLNGTADPVVPFGGGQILGKRGRVVASTASLEWWGRQNRCTTSVPLHPLPDRAPEDETRVYVESREGCAEGTSVTLYRVQGGGHTWPGGVPYAPSAIVGRTSNDIDASKVVFDFFASHTKP